MHRGLVVVLVLLLPALAGAAPPDGDAAGDVERGRALVADRSASLCALCHAVPGVPAHLQGNLAPSLAGVGARLDTSRLRAQLVEPRRLNPEAIMPGYRTTEGLNRVAEAWAGRPIFSAQQVEDVVAYLQTLR
ncbi:cytochrome c1 [Burkholderiales bacterium JOSHI_001]|nr:cytochrome c1 [Burkholderiales bacterium JOSHI_001]